MLIVDQNLPELMKEVRKQLALSQEDLARALGVSYATVNRWENGQVKPSKLAWAQFKIYCNEMTDRGDLQISEDLNAWQGSGATMPKVRP